MKNGTNLSSHQHTGTGTLNVNNNKSATNFIEYLCWKLKQKFKLKQQINDKSIDQLHSSLKWTE